MKKVIYFFKVFFIIATIYSLFSEEYFEFFWILAICAFIFSIIENNIDFFTPKNIEPDYQDDNKPTTPQFNYQLKKLLTPNEISFYQKIKDLENQYIIIPQVNLAAIIDKPKSKYRNELFRNVDFGIFTKDFELLLLIELNDNTHNKITRKDRDLKVQKILNDCKIKLIRFYTCYPNEKEYVIKRIQKNIEEKKENEILSNIQNN